MVRHRHSETLDEIVYRHTERIETIRCDDLALIVIVALAECRPRAAGCVGDSRHCQGRNCGTVVHSRTNRGNPVGNAVYHRILIKRPVVLWQRITRRDIDPANDRGIEREHPDIRSDIKKIIVG